MAEAGSLTVVGTGINAALHTTPESRRAIEEADEVLYLVADALSARWVEARNPRARPLHDRYGPAKPRLDTYREIADALLERVRAGVRLCAVFYGHPGVFVWPSHVAIREARAEGFEARMLPAVSALDCLVADLGIDPGNPGCVSYEATSFVLGARVPDTTATLVLWQPASVGERLGQPDGHGSRLPVLVDYLCRFYPREHEVIVYESSPYAVADPVVRHLQLGELTPESVPPAATLVVPAADELFAVPEQAALLAMAPVDGARAPA